MNVLLFLLFAAHNQRKVSPGEVHFITTAVEGWSASVVVPLRGVRRFLRTPPEIIDAEAAAALRQQVKQVELEAERLQQEALYLFMPIDKLGVAEQSSYTAARCNVEAYVAKFGADMAGPLIGALLNGFLKLDRQGQGEREGQRDDAP